MTKTGEYIYVSRGNFPPQEFSTPLKPESITTILANRSATYQNPVRLMVFLCSIMANWRMTPCKFGNAVLASPSIDPIVSSRLLDTG